MSAGLRELRGLSADARRAYLRRVALGFGRSSNLVLPNTLTIARSITFVCHGNIIRSAIAAALLESHLTKLGLSQWHVDSAGTHATEGKSADSRAREAAGRLGVSLAEHRATRLDARIVGRAGVLFVMDRLNEAEILARFPDAAGRIRRLGAFAPDDVDRSLIPDPYSGTEEDILHACTRIDSATHALAALLSTRLPDPTTSIARCE